MVEVAVVANVPGLSNHLYSQCTVMPDVNCNLNLKWTVSQTLNVVMM